MIPESIAILAISFLLLTSFMRSKYKKAALSILPISILPLLHLMSRGIVRLARGAVFGFRGMIVIAFVDVIAIGITCAIIVGLGHKINTRTSRRVYYFVMIGYTVIVGWVYIYTTLKPVLG